MKNPCWSTFLQGFLLYKYHISTLFLKSSSRQNIPSYKLYTCRISTAENKGHAPPSTWLTFYLRLAPGAAPGLPLHTASAGHLMMSCASAPDFLTRKCMSTSSRMHFLKHTEICGASAMIVYAVSGVT